MPTLLFINACVRGRDSRTLALAEHLLACIKEVSALYPLRLQRHHAALPLGFPLPDKVWDDGVFFHLPFFDTFLPAACSRRHLIYALMGAHTTLPYCWRSGSPWRK